MPTPRWHIVRTVMAAGVSLDHYTLDEARRDIPIGPEYKTRSAARSAIIAVAEAEAETHGLVVDPKGLPHPRSLYRPDALRLLPPDRSEMDKRYHVFAAQLTVERIKE